MSSCSQSATAGFASKGTIQGYIGNSCPLMENQMEKT